MLIHVQRENSLAHRTVVLRPWQVQALRALASRWFLALIALAVASWGYFAVQSARVPILTARLAHLEQEANRLDTLQRTLAVLQHRYEQVQSMLSAPGSPASRKDIRVDSARKQATAAKEAETAGGAGTRSTVHKPADSAGSTSSKTTGKRAASPKTTAGKDSSSATGKKAPAKPDTAHRPSPAMGVLNENP